MLRCLEEIQEDQRRCEGSVHRQSHAASSSFFKPRTFRGNNTQLLIHHQLVPHNNHHTVEIVKQRGMKFFASPSPAPSSSSSSSIFSSSSPSSHYLLPPPISFLSLSLLLLSFTVHSTVAFTQRSDILNLFNSTHPIIVIGLPKSGTTSVTQFLKLFSIQSAHQFIPLDYCSNQKFPNLYPIKSITVEHQIQWKTVKKPTHKCFIGNLIHKAIQQQQDDPLKYLFQFGYYAITQMDACYEVNYWPQIDALNYLLNAYPHAYYIHTIRPNVTAHANSIIHWSDLSHRMKINSELSRFPGQQSNQSNEENIKIFIQNAHRIVKHHFKRFPNYKFLELDLTKNNSGLMLAKFLNMKVKEDFVMPHANVGNYEDKRKRRKGKEGFWGRLFSSSS
jgi:hypothetical protein